MPSIIRIAKKWGIVDRPATRKSHDQDTPLLGGVGIFTGTVLISLLLIPGNALDEMRFVFAALTIIFIVGARDDLDPLTPWSKLMGQIIAITLLILFADVRISSLHGVFGIYELPYFSSVLLTTLFFIYLINSFNLIDGIDALCSSISVLILSVLGVCFFIAGETSLMIFSFASVGATLAFLKYNVSPSKVFMGDTGSLVLGTICTILLIHFLELGSNAIALGNSSMTNIAIALFVVPAFDTFRVFVNRILSGRSPLMPDRNHIHHLLLRAGCTHMLATVILVLVSTVFLVLAFQLSELSPTAFLTFTILTGYLFTSVIHIVIFLKERDALRTDP